MVSNQPKRSLRPRREVPAQGVFGPSRVRAKLTGSPGYTIGGPADPRVKKRIVSRPAIQIIKGIKESVISKEKVKPKSNEDGHGDADKDEDKDDDEDVVEDDIIASDLDDRSSDDEAVDTAYTLLSLPGRKRLAKRLKISQAEPEPEQGLEILEDYITSLEEKKGIAAAKALSLAGSGTPRRPSREGDDDTLVLDSSGMNGESNVYLDESSPTEQRSKRREKQFRDRIEEFRLEDEDVDFREKVSRGKHPVFNLVGQRSSTGYGSFGGDVAELSGHGKNRDHGMVGDTFEKPSDLSSKRKNAVNKNKGPSVKRTRLNPFRLYWGNEDDRNYGEEDEEDEESIICHPQTSSLIYMNKARTEFQRRSQVKKDIIDKAITQLNTSTNTAELPSKKQESPKGQRVSFEHEEDNSDFDEVDKEGFIRSPAPSPTTSPHSSSQANLQLQSHSRDEVTAKNSSIPLFQLQPSTHTHNTNNTSSTPKKRAKRVRFSLDMEEEIVRTVNKVDKNEEDNFEIEVGFGTRKVKRGLYSQSSNTNSSTPSSSSSSSSSDTNTTSKTNPIHQNQTPIVFGTQKNSAALVAENQTRDPYTTSNLMDDSKGNEKCKGETKEEAALKAGKSLLGKSGAELVAEYESSISPTKKPAVMVRLKMALGLE